MIDQSLASTTEPLGENKGIDKTLIYDEVKGSISQLITTFEKEKKETLIRRNARHIYVNREQLLAEKRITPDETYIPIRTCDNNIARELPSYMEYLTASKRLATFRCLNDPEVSTEALETAFYQAMTYDSWEIAHLKVIDGAAAHGWDAMEIQLDYSRPGGVNLSPIGHDHLVMPMEGHDPQKAEQILIRMDVSKEQLRSYIRDYDFNKEEIDILLDKGGKFNTELIQIYKRFSKDKKGMVWVSWYAPQAANWLKDPEPLFLGVRDPLVSDPDLAKKYEYDYPVEIFFYQETEQKQIVAHKGRVFQDMPSQEATTALITSFVNGLFKSSGIYAAPSNPINGVAPKITDLQLSPNKMYSEPMQFFQPPAPSPLLLQGINTLQTLNSEATQRPSWAVNNRKDSEKTATEIQSANQETFRLTNMQTIIYSTFLRRVFTRCWRIIQSLALQDMIRFMLVPDPNISGKYENNKTLIGKDYEVRPAGDEDVVGKQKKLEAIMQMLPLAEGTALKLPLVEDLIKILFDSGTAARYLTIMRQALAIQDQQEQQQVAIQQQMAMNNIPQGVQ